MQDSGEIKAEENIKCLVSHIEKFQTNQQTWTPQQRGRAGSLNPALCFIGELFMSGSHVAQLIAWAASKVPLGDSWDGLKEQFVWKERTGPLLPALPVV